MARGDGHRAGPRCGAHRAVRTGPGGNRCPANGSARQGSRSCRTLLVCCPHELLGGPHGACQRAVPTQSAVQGSLGMTPSSSSSQVWKLGTDPLRAGQRPSRHVGALCVGTTAPVSTRGQLCGCQPTAAVVHPLSPPFHRSVPRGCASDVDRGRRTGGAEVTKPLVNRLIHLGGQPRRRRCPAAPVPAAPHRGRAGFPNLCTSLGTTDRRVDRGHRPGTADGRLPSGR
jgi:hypothetical protein